MNRASALWSSGNYPEIATRFEPIATDLLAALGAELTGRHLLDLAAGTGNVALAAATRGAIVTATDITPRMVQLGQARTVTAGLTVRWVLADVGALPFAAATVDFITSCFGVMFAADPPAAVAEMARVLRPGGQLALVIWCPIVPPTRCGSRYSGSVRGHPRLPSTRATGDVRTFSPGGCGRHSPMWLSPAGHSAGTSRR